MFHSFPAGDLGVVIGSSGGIGSALVSSLGSSRCFGETIGMSRSTTPPLDILIESSIAASARWLERQGKPRLIVVASGLLQRSGMDPEKSLRQLDAAAMAESYAVNAIGPALVMKHFLPLLPREGKSMFAVLSARVGSIEDNHLGGWYSYRASKAALNQLVHTAAIELRRRHPQAICVALHPGTVDTSLSSPFAKSGLEVQEPGRAAERILRVIDHLGVEDSGGFFDQHGKAVPW